MRQYILFVCFFPLAFNFEKKKSFADFLNRVYQIAFQKNLTYLSKMRLLKNALLYARSCYSPVFVLILYIFRFSLFGWFFSFSRCFGGWVFLEKVLKKTTRQIKEFWVMDTWLNSNEENHRNFCAVGIEISHQAVKLSNISLKNFTLWQKRT